MFFIFKTLIRGWLAKGYILSEIRILRGESPNRPTLPLSSSYSSIHEFLHNTQHLGKIVFLSLSRRFSWQAQFLTEIVTYLCQITYYRCSRLPKTYFSQIKKHMRVKGIHFAIEDDFFYKLLLDCIIEFIHLLTLGLEEQIISYLSNSFWLNNSTPW